MELSQEQIDIFSSYILLSDVEKYINSHEEEYKEFLKNKKNKNT